MCKALANVLNKISASIKGIKMDDKMKILLISLACAGLILWYGNYRCNNPGFKDPLIAGKTICKVCDLWSVSHFVFFLVIGYLFPNEIKFAFTLGVIWEVFEFLVGTKANVPFLSIFYGLSECKSSPHLTGKKQQWIYHEWTDIGMNLAGLLIGKRLSTKYANT